MTKIQELRDFVKKTRFNVDKDKVLTGRLVEKSLVLNSKDARRMLDKLVYEGLLESTMKELPSPNNGGKQITKIYFKPKGVKK